MFSSFYTKSGISDRYESDLSDVPKTPVTEFLNPSDVWHEKTVTYENREENQFYFVNVINAIQRKT